MHFSSFFLALIFTNEEVDSCIWFLTNFNADSTVGVFFVWLLNKFADKFWATRPDKFSHLRSGYYGEPPRCTAYVAQIFVWSTIIILSKVFTTLIVYLLADPLNQFTQYLFSPLDNFPNVRAAISMGIYPLIVSSIVFLVQDSIMKDNKVASNPQQNNAQRYNSAQKLEMGEIDSSDASTSLMDNPEENMSVSYHVNNE